MRSVVHRFCGKHLHRFRVISSSKRCGWSYTSLHHLKQIINVGFLTTSSIQFHTVPLAEKSSGERVKATGTGKGYYWKSLAGALHSGDHWVMAVLAQTCEQLCCSCPPVVTKQVYLDTALLSPIRGGGEKRSPKHCLLIYFTWQPAAIVWLSSNAVRT